MMLPVLAARHGDHRRRYIGHHAAPLVGSPPKGIHALQDMLAGAGRNLAAILRIYPAAPTLDLSS